MSELLALGLSHKTAPLELRERLAMTEGRAVSLMGELTSSGIATEATILSTCNRTEFYLVAPDPAACESEVLGQLAAQAWIKPSELSTHLYRLRGPEAAEHLYQVTAGLDSMVIGEAEVQGQVKRAHELALVESASGPILNRLFRGALTAGGRARNETGINEKGVSVASVAVTEVERSLGDLADKHALIVGAGETGELVARALNRNGTEAVFVANRHYGRAQGLAERFGGGAARIDDLPRQMVEADIVVTATKSPHHLVDVELLNPVLEERSGRPLLLIDLAVPRDIDPAVRDLEGVSVIDVDDLKDVIEKNQASRAVEAVKAKKIITAELSFFQEWLDTLEVVPTIVALRDKAAGIVRQVIEDQEGRWDDLTDADRARIEKSLASVARRILHEPTLKLKEMAGTDAAYEAVSTVQELFGLEVDGGPENEPEDSSDEVAETPVAPILRQA